MEKQQTPEIVFNFSKFSKDTLEYLYDILECDFAGAGGKFDLIKNKKDQIEILDIITGIELELERKIYNEDIPQDIMKRINDNYNYHLKDIKN